ncbi:MAG: hypothetical protein MN733_22665 [Nitrososphaera sp.]|nr:hypothetical protein [Nitrososphaera sp.]
MPCDISTRGSITIKADNIIGIEREFFDGHVYTLQTSVGYYIASGLIVKNCRFLDGKVFLIDDPELDNLRPPRHHNCRSWYSPVFVDAPPAASSILGPQETGKAKTMAGKGFAGYVPTAKQ